MMNQRLLERKEKPASGAVQGDDSSIAENATASGLADNSLIRKVEEASK